MRNLIFSLLCLSMFTACQPVEKPKEPEKPPVKKTETIGPVVTIHCTLKNYDTGMVTKGTYFTYDTRTKHIPSDEKIYTLSKFRHEVENYKIWHNRLTDGIVVLPIKQHRNKFRLDLENIWYRHGGSLQFYLLKPENLWSSNDAGEIGFGKRRIIDGDDHGLEGYLYFINGNELGGRSGSWAYYGLGEELQKERGYLTCGTDISSGAGLTADPHLKP